MTSSFKINILLPLLVAVGVFHASVCLAERECKSDDYKFTYTECSNNTRWRVQVPKVAGACSVKSIANPSKAKACNFNCGPGKHLDIASQSCQLCPAGTFSIGAGLRWDNWPEVPEGFDVVAMPLDDEDDDGCTHSSGGNDGWLALGHYLGGRTSSSCHVSLIRKVTIAGSGSVTFRYQSSDEDTFFSFELNKGQCGSSAGPDVIEMLPDSAQGKVKSRTVNLSSGVNIMKWVLYPSGSTVKPSRDYPVKLLSIEVQGLDSAQGCQHCQAGYSSTAGSTVCTQCDRDHFSSDGSPCQACKAGEYAEVAATRCEVRPACGEQDYYASYTNCTNGKQQLQHHWLTPKICNDAAAGSVKLPAAQAAVDCATKRCSAGLRLVTDHCEFCPEGTYSPEASSSTSCKPCPARSQPVRQYLINRWFSLPPLVKATCLTGDAAADAGDAECSGELAGWLLMADSLQTRPMRLPAIRLLQIKLPGFTRHQSDLSVFTVEFEMKCKSSCKMHLLRNREQRQELIRTWKGQQDRHYFRYRIHTSDEHDFLLIFDPLPQEKLGNRADSGLGNSLHIYSINATDVDGSGAVSCRACPMGKQGDECVQCPAGQYYSSSSSSSCEKCPNGTYVATRPANSAAACQQCPAGLQASSDADSCVVDSQRSIADGKSYNLSQLTDVSWNALGGRLFSWRGTQYEHLFNISLRGDALCISNASGPQPQMPASYICRTTLVPSSHASNSSRHSSKSVSLLPVVIGNQLLNVSTTAESAHVADLLANAGWAADADGYDMHAFFTSDSATKACDNGRSAVLTMRCSSAHSLPEVQLPPKCPDGTCDGCVFHFMLLSRFACPLCRISDYERVKGECVMGSQVVHLYPPKHCYISGGQPVKKEITVACPLVEKPVAIVLLLTVMIGAISLLLACHCYRRNKRLQYKYTQLIESKEGGELPGVESCAVNEGDDDEDEDGDGGGRGGGGAVLTRIRRTLMPSGRSKSRNRKETIEHLNLADDMDDISI